ncbi:hypothetical protein WAK64_17535 [Bacillus spongiae]|uniref:Right handed beta helix domain-containing protein n=1 Tax=Bacillus spongiae TaxID=2683610 RepID=A0ABU8HIB2_9BACI
MTIFIVPDDFPTVQAVIDNGVPPILVSGDSIVVRAGNFPSFELPNQDQNGDPLERVRIAGCGIGKTTFFGGLAIGVEIQALQTYLKDFSVQGYSDVGLNIISDNNVVQRIEAMFNGEGFRIVGSDNTFSENIAKSNVSEGFLISGNNNCLVENTSNENTDGYRVVDENNILVDNVAKLNTGSGFLLNTQDAQIGNLTTLVGNTAIKNNIGINCQTDDNIIQENRCCNNTSIGIAIVGPEGNEPNGNRVDWNIVRGNGMMMQPDNAGIFVIIGAGTVEPNAITFNKLKLNENFSILDEAGPATPNIYNGNVCTDNPSSPPDACDPGIN